MEFKDSTGRVIEEYDIFRLKDTTCHSIYYVNKDGKPTLQSIGGVQWKLSQHHFEQEEFVGNLKDNLHMLKDELQFIGFPPNDLYKE